MEISSPVRTNPVSASIPIQVSWTGASGEHFDGVAKTLRISRHAATIVLAHKLVPTQEITIHSAGADKIATARVVGLIGREPDGHIYGVAFIDSNVNLWNIEFPADTESENTKSKVFIECASCMNRALVQLDEIQSEVFEARRIITLSCTQCGSYTVWGLASHESSFESDRESRPETTSAPVPRTVNQRKHVRVLTRMHACVRHAGLVEEVVRVKDASRGGFRFVSPNYYVDGSCIIVAMPYTRDASNVFVSARIMWRRELPRMKRYEYGVAYARSPERSRERPSAVVCQKLKTSSDSGPKI